MSRYIDVDEFLNKLEKLQKSHDNGFGEEVTLVSIHLKGLIRFIKVMPKADVVPVVHGEWIYNKISTLWECSNCHEKEICTTIYCPHCGARNRGGR